ncbi:MAG: T9SS type A sorting domain-containing protein, partial [Bacteroidetes bacterium]|nr:T9SS type A sorting domain-containing protein [Bacteroidota bacterium]
MEMCHDKAATSNVSVGYTSGGQVPANSVCYKIAIFSDGACSLAATSRAQQMPNVKFIYCTASSIPTTLKYSWSPTTGLDNPNIDTPRAYPSVTTTYVVTVWDSTDNNSPCVSTDVIAVFDTCGICDTIKPYISDSLAIKVTDSTFIILLSELVSCDSISFVDFELDSLGFTPTHTTIDSAIGLGCVGSETDSIFIRITPALPLGYTNYFRVAVNEDSCNIRDACDNILSRVGGTLNPGGMALILPIELLYFTAELIDDNDVLLNWETASETNNHHFIVERSVDGRKFESLGSVAAVGPYYLYQFIDKEPYSGINYYRLVQIDNNGNSFASNTIFIKVIASGFELINIRPVPTLDVVYVEFSSEKEGNVQIEVINLLGEVVMRQTVASLSGRNKVTLKIQHLESGVYYLNMTNQSKDQLIHKIIKQ